MSLSSITDKTLLTVLIGAFIMFLQANEKNQSQKENGSETITLPDPDYDGEYSIEQTLLRRRSIRSYSDEPLSLAEISQLLWAAQGITNRQGYRTAPSAGALYPLEVYLVAGNVNDLLDGIYHYVPRGHKLEKVVKGDKRVELWAASLRQDCVAEGAAVIVLSAVYKRTTWKYGKRGNQYVHIEVGHAAENVFLQAVALDLGAVIIGAFYDDKVQKVINMRKEEIPLLIIPIGKM